MSETNNKEKQTYIFKSVSLMDKFNFFEYLAVMVDGGVTLPQAIQSVSKRIKNPYFQEKIDELGIYISSGDQLSKAMKKIPDVFSQSETSIVEAGETSGTLVTSMTSLAAESKKLYELRQTVKQALTYPFIIMIFLVLAILIVMTYVVPSIIPLIDEAGVERPFATQALIVTSDFVSNNLLLILISIILIGFGYHFYSKSESGKKYFDELYLKLPLIGDVYRNYIIASNSSLLGVLMNAGIPVVKTIILTGKSSNNVVYESLYNEISSKVSVGKKIVESMTEVDEEGKYFPSDFVQLLSVGEKTASLGKVCKKLNEQYIREVNYSLANLTKWIEPIAILVAGVFVLWFAFAIFGAILKLTQTVG